MNYDVSTVRISVRGLREEGGGECSTRTGERREQEAVDGEVYEGQHIDRGTEPPVRRMSAMASVIATRVRLPTTST